MAKRQQVDENGNPIVNMPDYSNLPSVSDVLSAHDAGTITYKVDDVANRPLVITDASIEAGSYGSYAAITVFDPASKMEKLVTTGSTLIMTQVSALLQQNAIPCRVKFTKQGKTWTMQ